MLIDPPKSRCRLLPRLYRIQASVFSFGAVGVVLVGLGCQQAATRSAVVPHSQAIARQSPSEIRPPTLAPTTSIASRAAVLATKPVDDLNLARSLQNRPIEIVRFDGPVGRDTPRRIVLIHAGIHGNEPTTVFAANQLIDTLRRGRSQLIPPGTSVIVLPTVNPDGYLVRKRQNAAGVDLNRNFPASNWRSVSRAASPQYWNGPRPLSEPESRLLHDLVLSMRPVRILALHSIRPPRHGNNFDGPARALAERMSQLNSYDVLPSMGYPTPGSFGSWAGVDLGIPTITLEFPSNLTGPQAWRDNREAILAFIRGS